MSQGPNAASADSTIQQIAGVLVRRRMGTNTLSGMALYMRGHQVMVSTARLIAAAWVSPVRFITERRCFRACGDSGTSTSRPPETFSRSRRACCLSAADIAIAYLLSGPLHALQSSQSHGLTRMNAESKSRRFHSWTQCVSAAGHIQPDFSSTHHPSSTPSYQIFSVRGSALIRSTTFIFRPLLLARTSPTMCI